MLEEKKSHDLANLAIGHLKTKTGFRHRPTRRFGFNLGCHRPFFNGLLFIFLLPKSFFTQVGKKYILLLMALKCAYDAG
jgi:hypothetical protein